jgi:hypothetical protein
MPAGIRQGPDCFRFSHDGAFAALLRGAGLGSVTVETIAFRYPLTSADRLWNGVLGGSVRMAALIRRQPVELQARIRAEFERLVAEYRVQDGLEIPVSVNLATGRKPHR